MKRYCASWEEMKKGTLTSLMILMLHFLLLTFVDPALKIFFGYILWKITLFCVIVLGNNLNSEDVRDDSTYRENKVAFERHAEQILEAMEKDNTLMEDDPLAEHLRM